MTTATITYETPADGFGELATDDDRELWNEWCSGAASGSEVAS